jgi:hypothetical protein
MKRQKLIFEVVLLTAIAILAGCSADRNKELVVCQTEADRFYQDYQAFDVENPRSQYIIGCMAAKGYTFNITPADCDSRRALPTQPTCYTYNSWPAWIIDFFR